MELIIFEQNEQDVGGDRRRVRKEKCRGSCREEEAARTLERYVKLVTLRYSTLS